MSPMRSQTKVNDKANRRDATPEMQPAEPWKSQALENQGLWRLPYTLKKQETKALVHHHLGMHLLLSMHPRCNRKGRGATSPETPPSGTKIMTWERQEFDVTSSLLLPGSYSYLHYLTTRMHCNNYMQLA